MLLCNRRESARCLVLFDSMPCCYATVENSAGAWCSLIPYAMLQCKRREFARWFLLFDFMPCYYATEQISSVHSAIWFQMPCHYAAVENLLCALRSSFFHCFVIGSMTMEPNSDSPHIRLWCLSLQFFRSLLAVLILVLRCLLLVMLGLLLILLCLQLVFLVSYWFCFPPFWSCLFYFCSILVSFQSSLVPCCSCFIFSWF